MKICDQRTEFKRPNVANYANSNHFCAQINLNQSEFMDQFRFSGIGFSIIPNKIPNFEICNAQVNYVAFGEKI